MLTDLRLSKSDQKTIFFSSLGGTIEFYDFIIYVMLAPIISELFFPATDKIASLINMYAIFALGYIVRPIGGIVFSHFGDQLGRKKTFITSIMLMAIPTFLVGCLPTYQQVGIYAPLGLITLRILQGLSIGGEIPGAITFTAEHVSPFHRGFACAMIFVFLNLGILFGSGITTILQTVLNQDALTSWGWRIPFLLGGALGLFSYYLRRGLTESPLFTARKREQNIPLITCLKHYPLQLFQAVCLTWLGAVVVNMLFLFMPTYLTEFLQYSQGEASFFTLSLMLINSIVVLYVAHLSDQIGRRQIILFGAFTLIFCSYYLFQQLSDVSLLHLVAGILFIAITASFVAVFPAILVELFPTEIRYSGIAFSYNIGFAFFGGLTPLFSTYLIKTTGNVLTPSYYLIFSAVICFMATWRLQKQNQLVLA